MTVDNAINNYIARRKLIEKHFKIDNASATLESKIDDAIILLLNNGYNVTKIDKNNKEVAVDEQV